MIYGVIVFQVLSMQNQGLPIPHTSLLQGTPSHRLESQHTMLQCTRPTRGRWPTAHRSHRHDLARGYWPTGRDECPLCHDSCMYSGTVNTVSVCEFRGAFAMLIMTFLHLFFWKALNRKWAVLFPISFLLTRVTNLHNNSVLQHCTESEAMIYKTPSGRRISNGFSHERPAGYRDLFSAATAVTSAALLGRKQ